MIKSGNMTRLFMVIFVLGTLSPAQTFTTLYNFAGDANGGYPVSSLVQDEAGNLYGTAPEGGLAGDGVVFKVDSAGKQTVLHIFAGGPSDGAIPIGPLLRDGHGNLYGTTSAGGTNKIGVVYKIDSAGKETILHNFGHKPSDACAPNQGLIMDKQGNLYGATLFCGASSDGAVFKLTPTGRETVLHSFSGSPDGAFPQFGRLLMDQKGNLYGTTEQGGTHGGGTVYKLTPDGKLIVLHSFAGGAGDGCAPYGTPAMDNAGNLYGTTNYCGASGEGIVWKVSPKGAETVLHNFTGGVSDGAYPFAGVTLDSNRNIYGVTGDGGANGLGVVYELDKKGKLSVLHTFDGSNGEIPFAEILRDADGTIFGAAEFGGSSGKYGTVWELQ
ncbi:MAG TPA: choice-of-anchor tandem repeat GloVer-containing protein [Terriglobales bacterium]